MHTHAERLVTTHAAAGTFDYPKFGPNPMRVQPYDGFRVTHILPCDSEIATRLARVAKHVQYSANKHRLSGAATGALSAQEGMSLTVAMLESHDEPME